MVPCAKFAGHVNLCSEHRRYSGGDAIWLRLGVQTNNTVRLNTSPAAPRYAIAYHLFAYYLGNIGALTNSYFRLLFTMDLLPVELQEYEEIMDLLAREELARRDLLLSAIDERGRVTYQIFDREHKKQGTVTYYVNGSDVWFGGNQVIDENKIPIPRIEGTFGFTAELLTTSDDKHSENVARLIDRFDQLK